MVGRTPEYLGKKIQAYEVKMAMVSLLVLCLSTLGFTAWAAVSEWGKARSEQHRTPRIERDPVRVQFRYGQQWQRLRGSDGKHALVQYDAWVRHAHWAIPDDCAHYGASRVTRAEEDFRAQHRDVPGLRRHIHRVADRHSAVGRRAEFPPGAGVGSNCGALPEFAGETVLKSDSRIP